MYAKVSGKLAIRGVPDMHAYQEVRTASFLENFACVLRDEPSPMDIVRLKINLPFIKTRSQYTIRIEYLKKNV